MSSGERLFMDAAFPMALLNARDRYHAPARSLTLRVQKAGEVWTTEAVLIEVGNGLSAINRDKAARFIRSCYATFNMKVVTVDTSLLCQALRLYEARQDKTWGLTDCVSFVVMEAERLTLALTSDQHFRQAGFQPLLLEGSG